MSLHPFPTRPKLGPPGSVDGYRQVLRDLITAGDELIQLVHQSAVAKSATMAEVALAFDRVARAVRRCIVLRLKLDGLAASGADGHRIAARRQAIRAVEGVIQRSAGDAKALRDAFLDRLDTPDPDDDVARQPLAEIIADICRDVGLAMPSGAPSWRRRTPEDIATLCALAAAG